MARASTRSGALLALVFAMESLASTSLNPYVRANVAIPWFCFSGDFLSLGPYCLVPFGKYFADFFLGSGRQIQDSSKSEVPKFTKDLSFGLLFSDWTYLQM